MKATRFLSLALTTGLMGTMGCAQSVPSLSPAPAPAIPQLQATAGGSVAPDQLLVGDQQTMVNGQAMSVDQIRKLLPARISAADAAKMLVKIDMDQVVQTGEYDTQQRFGRGFGGRGFGRGFGGRRFFGRGFFGGSRFRSRFFGRGFGGLSYFPYSSYYFPYSYSAGYYYPYTYNYANTLCSPYLYGYGGSYYPYTYGWGM